MLHLSQPTLSRQMQELERELGCTLFERGKRRIELTEEGMRLRSRAEEIVDLVDRTEREFRTSPNTLAGEVRIGGGETPAISLVADIISELQNTYPLMTFSLYSGNAVDVSSASRPGASTSVSSWADGPGTLRIAPATCAKRLGRAHAPR